MKLTRNIIFTEILIFGLIANLLVYFDIQYSYLRAILSFVFLTIIPGLLIMLMLRIRKIGFWEYFVYTIGLSIAFLMFAGLAVNWLLPWLSITNKPLSLTPLLASFGIILSILGFIAYIRNKDISLEIKPSKLNWLNKTIFLIPVIFPFLSIIGATTLNNNGPNYFTMILLVSIPVYVIIVVILRKNIQDYIYPWIVLLISAPLLLIFSLRSWHIVGWDVNVEYQVFRITNDLAKWNISNLPNNIFNECISITILPTIFFRFLDINDEYIYKFMFQLLFSSISVSLYLFFTRYTNKIIAFLASFFFVSQVCFSQQMPALIRQEIALIFFMGILLSLSNRNFDKNIKDFLFLIFGICMIFSHYSTSYMGLGLFFLAKVFGYILNIFHKHKNLIQINLSYLILLSIICIFWYSRSPNLNGGVFVFIDKTINNIGLVVRKEFITNSLAQFLYDTPNKNNEVIISEYLNQQTGSFRQAYQDNDFYSKNTYINYVPFPIMDVYLNTSYPPLLKEFTNIIFRFVKIITNNVCVILGMIILIFQYLKKKDNRVQVIQLSFGCLVLLSLIIVIPLVTEQYDLSRAYLQLLIILALLSVIGLFYLTKFIKNDSCHYLIITILYIVYFLFYSGLIFQFITGLQSITLNNHGISYETQYITDSEIKSAVWLKTMRKSNNIYADEAAQLRLRSFGGINNLFTDINPATILRNSYVYLDRMNVENNAVFKIYSNSNLVYNYPTAFLNANKNLVYNNGRSKIYH